MNIKVILNPFANRWGAGEKQSDVEQALQAAGVTYDLTVTAGPGQGIDLAQEAARAGYDAVIAAGGDGTINEVVNGLIQAAPHGPTVPFGVMPIGAANDFNLIVGLPTVLTRSAQVIAAGQTRIIDAAQVNSRYFINNSAVAMEPTVTLETLKIKRLRGELRYLVGLLRAIIRMKAWQMDIEWDNGRFQGSAYLLSVCNSPRTGGFIMAPGAQVDDGVLNFVFAPEVPKRTVIAVLLRLMRGTHVEHPAVTYLPTTRLRLTSEPGTPVHADGEVFDRAATAVAYQVLPGKVRLLSP